VASPIGHFCVITRVLMSGYRSGNATGTDAGRRGTAVYDEVICITVMMLEPGLPPSLKESVDGTQDPGSGTATTPGPG
jgi:hypothetical protein